MTDLRLRYEGNGRFTTATHLDFEEAREEFDKGDVVNATLSRPRSVSQNRFFHALIEAAHENQRGGERFANWRTLKGYLLVNVGHCTEKRLKLPKNTPRAVGIAMGREFAAQERDSDHYVGVSYDPRTNELVRRFPGSMKIRGHGAIGGEEANAIVDKVVTLICEEIIPGARREHVIDDARVRIGAPERKKAA